MKKLAYLAALSAILLGSVCFATDFRRAKPTLSDVHAASCRVRVSNASGSGIFIHYENEKCYFLTNHHVVESNGTAKLDFWTNSVMQTVTGRVVSRYRNDKQNRDFAVIEVNAADLKKIDPPYIPLAPIEPSKLNGLEIMSAGGPKGRFVVCWRGKNGAYDGGIIIFSPAPAHGQSGSGICAVIDGEIYTVATLTYLLGEEGLDSSKGGALPVLNFANALYGRSGTALEEAQIKWTNRTLVASKNEKSYRVLAFTSPECPACVVARPGLERLAKEGEDVREINASTPEGVKIADDYGVNEMPTYLITDANWKELERVTPDVIKTNGSYEATKVKLVRVRNESEPEWRRVEPAPPMVEPAGAYEDEVQPDNEYRIDGENGVVISKDWEMKKTLPVFITDPATYDLTYEPVTEGKLPASVDLFKSWRDHGNKNAPAPPEEFEETPPEPQDNESKRWAPGDKMFDALSAKLEKKIDGSIKNAANQIVTGLGDKVGGALTDAVGKTANAIEENINTRLDEKQTEIKGKVTSWLRATGVKIIFFTFILVFLAVLAARLFVHQLKWIFENGNAFMQGGKQAMAKKAEKKATTKE